jgi:hypothetical protein
MWPPARQREALEMRRIDNSLEITHERVERKVLDVPVRKAVPARVVE